MPVVDAATNVVPVKNDLMYLIFIVSKRERERERELSSKRFVKDFDCDVCGTILLRAATIRCYEESVWIPLEIILF